MRNLHAKFIIWSKALKYNSRSVWQLKIANIGINLIEKLYSIGLAIYKIGAFGFQSKQINNNRQRFIVNGFVTFSFYSILISSPLMYIMFPEFWIFGTLILVSCIFIFCSIIIILFNMIKSHEIRRALREDKREGFDEHGDITLGENDMYVVQLRPVIDIIMIIPEELIKRIVPLNWIILFSTFLSLFAIIITIFFIPEHLLNTFWYTSVNKKIIPTYPFLLTSLNMPFDILTIQITLLLLNYVKFKKKYFGVIALANILLSLVLSITLYALLIFIQEGKNVFLLPNYFLNSITFFSKLFTIFIEFLLKRPFSINIEGLQDIHLVPILLTTFVPVSIYMSSFIFLYLSKPVMIVASFIFDRIGKKEESVFKQLGTLVAVWMASIKAIYDYLSAP